MRSSTISFSEGLISVCVDLDGFHLALAGERDGYQPAARRPFDLELVELGLHRLHLGLELGGLLHQAEEISHLSSLLCRSRASINRETGRQSSSSSGRSSPP